MTSLVVQLERLRVIDGYALLDGFAFDNDTKRAPKLHFYDLEDDTPHELAATQTWTDRAEVAMVHSLADTKVGFRAAVDVHGRGEPFDPVRLGIGAGTDIRTLITSRGESAPSLRNRVRRRHALEASSLLPPNHWDADPSFTLMNRFIDLLGTLESGAILEIGSRARSGLSRKHLMSPKATYVGVDVLEGPNVDVVGDVHELSKLVPHDHFTHAFAVSVWEHLLAPWRVSLELNAVLADGGLAMIATHQTWPVHDEPSDYWRFSKWSWKALFNADTGFEIVKTAMGLPGTIVSQLPIVGTVGLENGPAFLSSSVLVRKVGPARLSWDLDLDALDASHYPEGESAAPT